MENPAEGGSVLTKQALDALWELDAKVLAVEVRQRGLQVKPNRPFQRAPHFIHFPRTPARVIRSLKNLAQQRRPLLTKNG